MEHGAVAERLGAERVLPDRLQHPPERRVHDAQEHEKGDADDGEDEIIGEKLAVRLHAEDRMIEPFEPRLQGGRNLERAPVLPARQPGELRRQHVEDVGDGERHHGEEDRLDPQREKADRQRERERQDTGDAKPEEERAPARPERVKRDADTVGADAEDHHVREGDDAGVAKQHIVGGDEQDHHADLRRRVERLGAGKQERRQRQRQNDQDDQRLQRAAAGRIAGKNVHRPLTG